MQRRTFLLSGSAAALVLIAPNTAAALAPAPSQFDLPIRTYGVIEQALDVATKYGFTPVQQAWLFGLEPSRVENFDRIRDVVQNFVVRYGSIDMWNRVRFLAAIREKLDAWHPRNIEMQTRFIDASLDLYQGDSLRDLLLEGPLTEMHRAASLLGCKVEYHDFADRKNFG